jgi:hypothetical protein
VTLDSSITTITGPPGTEERRRLALYAYAPGLGTSNTTDTDTDLTGAGDSVLLRFVPLRPPQRGSPEVTP